MEQCKSLTAACAWIWIYTSLLVNFIGQHRPSAAMICVTFRSDCFKNDFLCEAETSGFNVCSNMRECLDFGK